MASAYKSMTRNVDSDDSSDKSDEHVLSEVSSSTLRGDSPAGMHSEAERPASLPIGLKNRILMLTTRGVSYRHRHLLSDLHSLFPHSQKDNKLDTKSSNNYNAALNALADLHSCNYVVFLEARKHGQDLYLWLAHAPNGPTIKFSVGNVHTMAELGFGGNCLKGGRGIVVFDKSFEDGVQISADCKSLIREMLRGVFCVPSRGIRGMKPFVDRIIGIYGLDDKIWIRAYEIRDAEARGGVRLEEADISLIEIGPRMVLTPVVVLEGSFGGPVLFENKQFVSPNQVRREARIGKAGKYARRRDDTAERAEWMRDLELARRSKARTDLDDRVLFS